MGKIAEVSESIVESPDFHKNSQLDSKTKNPWSVFITKLNDKVSSVTLKHKLVGTNHQAQDPHGISTCAERSKQATGLPSDNIEKGEPGYS